jgi:hypothetical protein
MPDPKILLLDIETAPAKVWCWQLFDQNIGLDQIIEPGRIICWGAKWLGHREMFYADERAGATKMFVAIHTLMEGADAIITYNGDSFDLPKLNGAFVEHGLPPVPPSASIDLFKTVRKLGYQSGKLAFVAPLLKIGKKIKNEGFPLWSACLAGDKAAWNRMQRYNAGDVRLLQGLYQVLRPYIRNHPYLGTTEPEVGTVECPMCQSRRGQSRGFRRTKAFLIQRIQCLGCGGWFDGTKKRVT